MKKQVKSYYKAEVTKVDIAWSIHQCKRFTKNGKADGCETKYMTVKKVGRRKEQLMHETLGEALKEVGV